MATRSPNNGTKTTITVTLTSLANGSGRESTVIDTSAMLDIQVRVITKGQASGTALLDVYAYAALGDANYLDGATGSDAAFTAANRRNSPWLLSVQMNAASGAVSGMKAVAQAFGGTLPSKVGLIFINSSGAALSATGGDHVIEYQGYTETIA